MIIALRSLNEATRRSVIASLVASLYVGRQPSPVVLRGVLAMKRRPHLPHIRNALRVLARVAIRRRNIALLRLRHGNRKPRPGLLRGPQGCGHVGGKKPRSNVARRPIPECEPTPGDRCRQFVVPGADRPDPKLCALSGQGVKAGLGAPTQRRAFYLY